MSLLYRFRAVAVGVDLDLGVCEEVATAPASWLTLQHVWSTSSSSEPSLHSPTSGLALAFLGVFLGLVLLGIAA